MIDFGDRMMDFLFDVNAPEKATYELFRQAVEHFPDHETSEVYDYFMIWVWSDWIEEHAPPMPEMTEEELDALMARMQPKIDALLKAHRGTSN